MVSSITYNGAIIASLESGQTATLHCAGKRMEDNVVIKKSQDADNDVTVQVRSDMQAHKVEGGKNLLDLSVITYLTYKNKSNTTQSRWGVALQLPAGEYVLSTTSRTTEISYYIYMYVNNKDGNYINALYNSDGSQRASQHIVETKNIYSPVIIKLNEGGTVYLVNAIDTSSSTAGALPFAKYNMQLEAGTTPTEYEPYGNASLTLLCDGKVMPEDVIVRVTKSA